jgi:hypothetical protein
LNWDKAQSANEKKKQRKIAMRENPQLTYFIDDKSPTLCAWKIGRKHYLMLTKKLYRINTSPRLHKLRYNRLSIIGCHWQKNEPDREGMANRKIRMKISSLLLFISIPLAGLLILIFIDCWLFSVVRF